MKKVQTPSLIIKLGRRPSSSGGGINEPEPDPRRTDGPESDGFRTPSFDASGAFPELCGHYLKSIYKI